MDKIENTEATSETLSRRKALGRIGLIAAAAYTVPAFTTLSMAHASGSSEASDSSDSSDASDTSDASDASAPSLSVPSAVEDVCGEDGDLTSSEYVQCLVDNGVELPEGFVLPDGVVVP